MRLMHRGARGLRRKTTKPQWNTWDTLNIVRIPNLIFINQETLRTEHPQYLNYSMSHNGKTKLKILFATPHTFLCQLPLHQSSLYRFIHLPSILQTTASLNKPRTITLSCELGLKNPTWPFSLLWCWMPSGTTSVRSFHFFLVWQTSKYSSPCCEYVKFGCKTVQYIYQYEAIT